MDKKKLTGANMLKFGKGNAKLGSHILTFSISAGSTCPGAKECKSKVIVVEGKRTIKDGPHTKFRCFAASSEVLFPNVHAQRQHNVKELMTVKRSLRGTVKLITSSLPPKAKYVRLHVSGDFFSQLYFDAWIVVANRNKDVLFYAYTKSIKYWLKRKDKIPTNLVLTASLGGKYDKLVKANNLRYAKVVFTEKEASKLGLEIDHDDSHAMKAGKSFALLLHGIQPKNSKASKARTLLGTKALMERKLKVAANV